MSSLTRRILGIAALFVAAGCAATQQGPLIPETDAAVDAHILPPDAAAPPAPDAPLPPDAAEPPDAAPPDGPPDAPPPDATPPPDACVPAPGGEICNGVDDDCDRMVDEGFAVGTVCTAGVGTCAKMGMNVCKADGSGVECDAVPGKAGPVDLCGNDEDDDCDGETDEDFPDLGKLCSEGVGACKQFGVWQCNTTQDGLDCDAVPSQPGPELCGNGIDDNCNGVDDEGFPSVGQPCSVGVGECESFGVVVCNPADRTKTMCGATPGAPKPETCNGDDDNCNGMTDEGDPGGGGACVTPNPGICGPGHLHCSFGQLACVPDNMPGTELCNGDDDNCNGLVDEGFHLGEACDDPTTPDFCAHGVYECQNEFASVCIGDTVITESCNNADDDCDGDVDENWDFLNDPNRCGGCNNVCGSLNVETRQCTGGACNPVCAYGYQSCDGNLVNGCESLRNTNPACPSDYTSGEVSGDVNRVNVLKSGYGEARYRVRVREQDDGWDDQNVAFIITNPDGVNMDICVHCGGCNGTIKCAQTNGRTDVVYVKADETPWPLPGNDDSFDAFVDVNYAGADRTACGPWTLTIDSEAAIPDGADVLDCD